MHQLVEPPTGEKRVAQITERGRVTFFDPDNPQDAWLSAVATLPAMP